MYSDALIHTGLKQVISESYNPMPAVVILKQLYNVKEWLDNSINDIHGHSEPLCFKFDVDSDNKSPLFTARWSEGLEISWTFVKGTHKWPDMCVLCVK